MLKLLHYRKKVLGLGMGKGYRIARKFGKGIVNGDGVQVAWVDDYVMAKAVCIFLNGSGIDYPDYVKIGDCYYRLVDGCYYCAKSGVTVDFTVDGCNMYSVSGDNFYDRLLVYGCCIGDWYDYNGKYL